MEKSGFFKKIKKYKKIAIISQDAGGAEILSSLCTSIKQKKKYYLKGPAKKIFKKNLKMHRPPLVASQLLDPPDLYFDYPDS